MRKMQYFKIKRGSAYDKEVKKHFRLRDKWADVMFDRVSELLGQKIERMAFSPDELYIVKEDIKDEETRKLFTQSGKLKANIKKANELREKYIQIVKEEGFSDYEELRYINFHFDVMRYANLGNPDHMESFRTSEDDIYFEADFDLEKRSNGSVVPITEVEFREKYLEELRKREEKS